MQPPHSEKAKDITLSKEETERLEECFRDKKFRDLLSDYVREISNPSTKLAYEQYLQQVENEGDAPKNRELMKPIPIFCIKAKVIPNNNKKHIFINCCLGKLVKDAVLSNSSGYDHPLNCSGTKKAGLCWQIPYILGHKRFDNNDGNIIYDIAFSETTIKLLHQDISFKNIVIQTALEAVNGIEKEYNLLNNGKKYKILKTNKYKGNIDPPLMSVIVNNDDQQKRMINTKKEEKMEKMKEMKYKIIESNDMDIEQCWNDNNLLIEPLKRPKQIYIMIKLENIKTIKDIDCQINKNNKYYTVSINVKNNKYKKCDIDLKHYDIISSSMNASWYKNKNELKLTFDIAPFTKQEIKKIREKYSNIKKQKESQIIIPSNNDNDNNKNGNDSFLLKEVETKCIMNKDDNKEKEEKNDNNNNDNNNDIPLCHHKLPMKQLNVKGNDKKSFWICSKPQNEKCTSFKWNDHKNNIKNKILIKDFEIEKRVKFDKIVFLIRITNIIQSSVNIKFHKNGEIMIQFETHKYKYDKIIKIDDYNNIDINKSKFDVNCRNLLIMAVKQKQIEKNNDKNDKNHIDSSIDDILNDSALFQID